MAIKYDVTMKERYLAVVLLDIIGSTAFVQRNGAVVAAKWFQVHDRLARSLVYKHSGREIDRSDGFLLSFDRIIDAVNFGLAYQRTVPKKTSLQTRIGIHWGRVIEVKQEKQKTSIQNAGNFKFIVSSIDKSGLFNLDHYLSQLKNKKLCF